ncbi:MAG: AEC family transporter [Eubacteriales bacterium]|nr:AEC family transporter [Eubacteriales bacterium]
MENLLLSVEIVLPLFLVMLVGFVCNQLKVVSKDLARQINGIVFRVFLPVLLCKNIYQSSLDSLMNPGVFVFSAVGILVMFFALFWFIPRIEPDRRKCSAMIQAIFRSNYAYFGIPLVQAIFPNMDTSVTSLLVVVVVPLFNVLAVIELEYFRGGKADPKQILKKIVTNPLIIGSLAGLVILLTGLPIPGILQKPIDDLSKVATPMALFLLGASIDFSKTGAHIKQLTLCVVGKLVFWPVLAVAAAALLGLRNVELASVLIVFGAPTAVNSAVMSQQMGADGDLATEAVVFTTVFSALTVFLFIFVLKSLSLI